jgi:hypothetical protein
VASREEAEKNLEIVTHEGACGTCSTFQDLAVYLSIPDLATVGIACTLRSLIAFADGLKCYMDYGFTEACATIWIYGSLNTYAECPSCLTFGLQDLPNNLEPPTCYLAECIQCDEDESGPIFKEYAARTRRGSGLLTAIVRNCTSIPRLVHRDPCDDTALTLPPTSAPTEAPSEASGNTPGVIFSLLAMAWIGMVGV